MNISIKNKFSIIIIFMSLLSLFFAYIISNEFISKNLKDKDLARDMEKVLYVKREIKNIEDQIFVELKILSELKINERTSLAQDFFEMFIKRSNGRNNMNIVENVHNSIEEQFIQNSNYFDKLEISFINKNGVNIDKNGINEEEKIEFNEFANGNGNWRGSRKYYWKNGELYYLASIPVIDEYKKDNKGIIVISFSLREKFFNRLKEIYAVDFILKKNDEPVVSTLQGDLKQGFVKDKILEFNNKLYNLAEVDIDENINGLFMVFDKEKFLKEKSELSSYLFVALFFVFTLLFIVSTTLLNVFVDSLRRLTLKINSLKDGNFNVNLGDLKNSNDEIGILAHDFELMVHILKSKIKELEEANDNNKHYSARLEKVNLELKESQKKIIEKSENIDRINKLLNSRITEISNMYYLMMNISKYMIDEKFYDIIIKGVREGLGLPKVALYIVDRSDNLILKKSLGFDKISSVINIDGIDKILLKKEHFMVEELLVDKDFGIMENSYIFPLISSREEEVLYGLIVISTGEKIKQEFKKSVLTYVKAIVMAIENRKLYLRLIEENKKLEDTTKELQESEIMKNMFISNISHELRVPLVPIKGYHEIMLEEHMGPLNFKQKKALKTSLKNIERLQEIIENILNYSRIESGKYQILNTRVDVEEILDEALVRLENVFESKKVEIVKEYPENGAFIKIDKEALKQIFINLISNAIKFSKENKVTMELTVSETNDNRYKICISDNGVGMEKSKIEFVLKSFRQIEEGDTRKYSGIGLGLTVVEKILGYYGEKIYINSSLNKGTEVYFYFKKG